MGKRIGILGGTFNPVHEGHMIMAEKAYEQFNLDIVYFMPNNIPPHKIIDTSINDTDRVNMILAAIKDKAYFDILTIELEREEKSYTADTLKILHEKYPDDKLFFILGGDSIFAFETWYHPEEILKQAVILACGRYEGLYDNIDDQIKYISNKYENIGIFKLIMSPVDISSTEIRSKVKAGDEITGLVPKQVEKYIYKHNIYR